MVHRRPHEAENESRNSFNLSIMQRIWAKEQLIYIHRGQTMELGDSFSREKVKKKWYAKLSQQQ